MFGLLQYMGICPGAGICPGGNVRSPSSWYCPAPAWVVYLHCHNMTAESKEKNFFWTRIAAEVISELWLKLESGNISELDLELK